MCIYIYVCVYTQYIYIYNHTIVILESIDGIWTFQTIPTI